MDKTTFRKRAIQRLKSLNRTRAILFDKRINRYLIDTIPIESVDSVMLYIPLKMEANITPIIKEFRKKGVSVYVPFMEGESFRLVKYRLPLKRKRFGIYEPKISRQYRVKKIDIAIVPIVGTDPTFRRVGFGKGMYDRFFQNSRRFIEDIIFVERLFCFSEDIITQEHDISAYTIVTGKTVVKRGYRDSISYRHRKILNSIS